MSDPIEALDLRSDAAKLESRVTVLEAEIERLGAVVDLAFAYRNASFSDQEDIGLELDTALEGGDE